MAATLEASLLPPRQPVPKAYLTVAAQLSEASMAAYRELVYETPGFTDYFFAATPIREIAELNILHAAGLALLRQELGPGKAGAYHQQRVALRHHVGGGLGAEKPDRAGHEGAERSADGVDAEGVEGVVVTEFRLEFVARKEGRGADPVDGASQGLYLIAVLLEFLLVFVQQQDAIRNSDDDDQRRQQTGQDGDLIADEHHGAERPDDFFVVRELRVPLRLDFGERQCTFGERITNEDAVGVGLRGVLNGDDVFQPLRCNSAR